VTVVDRGGYSAAAEHLGLAQSTVSFHVRSLEQRYAVPLMRYEHRPVRLAPPGQRLYQTAKTMLAEEEQLVQVISGRHSGQVKLGASMAFEHGFFFTHVVAPFHRAHEDILLSLRFGHSVAIAEAVLEHHLDLGYLIGWHIPSGLRYEALHRAAFTFLVRGNIPSPPAAQSPSPISPRRVSPPRRVSSPHHSTRSSGLTTRMCCTRWDSAPPTWHWKWTVCKRGYWPPKQVSAC